MARELGLTLFLVFIACSWGGCTKDSEIKTPNPSPTTTTSKPSKDEGQGSSGGGDSSGEEDSSGEGPKLDAGVEDLGSNANVPSRCKIEVKGDGPKIIKAAVKAGDELQEGEIDGQKVAYDCFPAEAGDRVDLIATVEGKRKGKTDTVYWGGVPVGSGGQGEVENAARKQGVPDMSKELRAKLEREIGIKAPDPLVKVTFENNQLAYANIELKGKTNKGFTLQGKPFKGSFKAGSYTLKFQSKVGGKWESSSQPLVFKEGKEYMVKMKARAPFYDLKEK